MDHGSIVLVKGYPTLYSALDKNIKIKTLEGIETDLHITNICFTLLRDDSQILYASTTKELFFYKIFDKEERLFLLNSDSGAYSNCLFPRGDKLLMATSMDTQILEYINLEMGPSLFFEGKKQYAFYFKNYIVFVVIDDKTNILAIYDKNNRFFSYYNTNYSKISGMCSDGEYIFAFVEVAYGLKKLVKLKEKDNKYKFEIFYKRSFFDNALEYAKNLNYDNKKIAEIHQRHGDHLYVKQDFFKAVEQYIYTINYLDPSSVIQKFLDGSKLDYLILYLEALHKENSFEFRCQKEMKDYTALLLNCYIKQKQIMKLKEFVEGKDISPQLLNVETAIEVCKDTNQIDLALNIAEKSKMFDAYVQLMIDYKKNYSLALEYVKKEGNIEKNLETILKHGQKLLNNAPEASQRFIKEIVSQILSVNNNSGMNYKYEKVMKVYINQDKLLEELLDFIIMKDEDNCSNQIIHRRVELYLEKIVNGINVSQNSEKILKIINHKKFSTRYDQNYLLMIFKTHKYTQGIISLSEIMQLRQELLTIYMENHNNDKIISICTNYAGQDSSYWIQALNYFINSSLDNKYEYIQIILDKVTELDIISPIVILDILKTKETAFETIREFFLKILRKENKMMTDNKAEFDKNDERYNSYSNETMELKTKATQFSMVKCAICNQPTNNVNVVPVVFFLCHHAFHLYCLNAEIRDDNKDESQCPTCWQRSHHVLNRIKQSEEKTENFNEFKMELEANHKKFDHISKFMGMGMFKTSSL